MNYLFPSAYTNPTHHSKLFYKYFIQEQTLPSFLNAHNAL